MCVEMRDPGLAYFQPAACALPELSVDMKRMLKVQWKEFLHWLDENSPEPDKGQSELGLRQQLEPATALRVRSLRLDFRRL